MSDVILTPRQCAAQFRLYADTHPSPDSRHSLNFCADFLEEFCLESDELDDLRAAMETVLRAEADIEKKGGPQTRIEETLLAVSSSLRRRGWVWRPDEPVKVVKLNRKEDACI